MPASGGVLRAAVFDMRRIVGMAGPRIVDKRGVVRRTDVRVADDRGNRRTAAHTVYQPAEEFRHVRLPARGGVSRPPRCAAIQEYLQARRIDALPCRDALYGNADRLGMRLSEKRQAKILTVAAAHASASNRARSVQNAG